MKSAPDHRIDQGNLLATQLERCFKLKHRDGSVIISLPRRRMNAAVSTALFTGVIVGALSLVTFFHPVGVTVDVAIGGALIATLGFLLAKREIEISQDGLLHARRRLGPIRSTETHLVDDLSQLRIVEYQHAPLSMTRTSQTTDLIADFGDHHTLTLAEGYPRHVLRLLVVALRQAMIDARFDPTDLMLSDPTPARAVRSDDVERPAASAIEVEESPSETVLRIPALGWTDRLRRLRMTSMIMILGGGAFMAMFGVFAVSTSWQSWLSKLFLVVWVGFPALITAAGLHYYFHLRGLARYELIIRCDESGLRCTKRSGFWSAERLIPRHAIVEVRAGSAGDSVPRDLAAGAYEALPELQIWLLNGRGRFLMQGLNAQDIRWGAVHIRRALGVPAVLEETW